MAGLLRYPPKFLKNYLQEINYVMTAGRGLDWDKEEHAKFEALDAQDKNVCSYYIQLDFSRVPPPSGIAALLNGRRTFYICCGQGNDPSLQEYNLSQVERLKRCALCFKIANNLDHEKLGRPQEQGLVFLDPIFIKQLQTKNININMPESTIDLKVPSEIFMKLPQGNYYVVYSNGFDSEDWIDPDAYKEFIKQNEGRDYAIIVILRNLTKERRHRGSHNDKKVYEIHVHPDHYYRDSSLHDFNIGQLDSGS